MIWNFDSLENLNSTRNFNDRRIYLRYSINTLIITQFFIISGNE